MDLRDFVSSLKGVKRREFATKIGTTVGHLNNMAYGHAAVSALYAARIERESNGVVTRAECGVKGWEEIWFELAERLSQEGTASMPASADSSPSTSGAFTV